MGIKSSGRKKAMTYIEPCRVQTLPKPLPGETRGEFIVDCSLEFWMIVSAKLNGERPVTQIDDAFYETIVRDYHAKMLAVASNFSTILIDIVYVTDSGKPPLPKSWRKTVRVTPVALQHQLDDARRPVIHASEVAATMRLTEATVLPYLFEQTAKEKTEAAKVAAAKEAAADDAMAIDTPEETGPFDGKTAAQILERVAARNLLSDKATKAITGDAFSLAALCAALNKDGGEAEEDAEPAKIKRAPQPWKPLINDTAFRRNQIARCNERLYALILAGALPCAQLHGMFHEHVTNDGLRRRLHAAELGEADYIISNRTLQPNVLCVIVTNDSDQLLFFLLRHARLANTVIWYENQVEGRFYHLSLLRSGFADADAAEEAFRRRALSYVLCGTDFTNTRAVESPDKIYDTMQQAAGFSLTGEAWRDPPTLVASIGRIIDANLSKAKRATQVFSTAEDVARNLFYQSGELFRLNASSTQ